MDGRHNIVWVYNNGYVGGWNQDHCTMVRCVLRWRNRTIDVMTSWGTVLFSWNIPRSVPTQHNSPWIITWISCAFTNWGNANYGADSLADWGIHGDSCNNRNRTDNSREFSYWEDSQCAFQLNNTVYIFMPKGCSSKLTNNIAMTNFVWFSLI